MKHTKAKKHPENIENNNKEKTMTKKTHHYKKKKGFFSRWFRREPVYTDKSNKVTIHYGWTRANTKQIIKQLLKQGCDHFYFYTDSANIFLILEQGIRPIKSKQLKKGVQYTVWTYLEKPEHIELELANSSRHQFWNWCLENNIDLMKVAIFYIDLVKLYHNTKKDWSYDNELQRVIINEDIPITAIEGILIKDALLHSRLQQYIEHQNIDVKIFYGDKNIVEEVREGKQKK